jgi:molybdenum cofactor cytidylyltransferase
MIAGIVLAAGMSTRMGRPKMTLPWKSGRTVVGEVLHALLSGGADRVLVVTGADREAVERAAEGIAVRFVHNEEHAVSGMFSSIKCGLRALDGSDAEVALITPGDLPAIRPDTVAALISAWRETRSGIIAPSHAGRRGHPVLLGRSSWPRILATPDQSTLRDFLMQESAMVRHVIVDDLGIVSDLDTPDDYQKAQNGRA